MKDSIYNYICSGYLVKNGKILLVLHNGFKKWVPPGGHVEDGETFSQAAEREFVEETGIQVHAISAAPVIHQPDHNATPLPLPFYTDVMIEGFKRPTIGQYFYMRCDGDDTLNFDIEELDNAGWFSLDEIVNLETFEQVRSICAYAIEHYPATL